MDPGDLTADCARCFGLCCVAPAFGASADFAIDKPAGRPCPNLRDDFRCGIHADLRVRGFAGCTVYDCFGAGQQVAQVTFGGRDWRQAGTGEQMFAAFGVMRQLHELLWHLTEALTLAAAGPVHEDLRHAIRVTRRMTVLEPDALLRLDVNAHRQGVNPVLRRASELARAGTPGPDRAGADLVGADLSGADLRGASLRGAYLIGTDLRRADLRLADVTAADLRGADLRGADLRGALFLTQAQLGSAHGDARTKLAASRRRPGHWGSAAGVGS